MNKKDLLKRKKAIIKKLRPKLDEKTIKVFNKLGFSIKNDSDGNLLIWDNSNDKRMYVNTHIVDGMPYKVAVNEFYILEFTLFNNKLTNITLYEKDNGYKLVYKK